MNELSLQNWRVALQERFQHNRCWYETLSKRVQDVASAYGVTHSLWHLSRAHRQTDAFFVYRWWLFHPAFAAPPTEECLTVLMDDLTQAHASLVQQCEALGAVYQAFAALPPVEYLALVQECEALADELTRLTALLDDYRQEETITHAHGEPRRRSVLSATETVNGMDDEAGNGDPSAGHPAACGAHP